MQYVPATARCIIFYKDEEGKEKQKTKTFNYVRTSVQPEALQEAMTLLYSLSTEELDLVQLVTTSDIE